MLADRLLFIIQAILEEYRQFNVQGMFSQALNLAAQKGTTPPQQYQHLSTPLRQMASKTISGT